jgi:hypothetical protein
MADCIIRLTQRRMAIHLTNESTLKAGAGSHHSSNIIMQLLLAPQGSSSLIYAFDLHDSTGI